MNHGQFYKADELAAAVHRDAGGIFAGFAPRMHTDVSKDVQPWTVGRTTMSPTLTSSGCSIANAIARAIASGSSAISSICF
jgi:hypothetical protein